MTNKLILNKNSYLLENLKLAYKKNKQEIDWNCDCLKPYLKGKCINEFKTAYECYLKSGENYFECKEKMDAYMRCKEREDTKNWVFSFFKSFKK